MIQYDPDDWVTESTHRTCPYHVRHPGASYPGCTCSASIGQRRKRPDEYTERERVGDWVKRMHPDFVEEVFRDLGMDDPRWDDDSNCAHGC